ncbi:ATP-binding cassette domain-containing protein [Aeromicrobium sp. 636]|uniref:ABC-type quaternary amine transporter n=1 Tax=Aeromicrobium senzhongii TaxID=2663859 RepID=A0A8I0ERL0_9ACTN|nr:MULTISPECIES: ABC transporter ATP-binding protein [Aeromicrobium]MBC9225121.1 ABC transporter ATP-binding protein [Aeromicrobium senzhongii]MCQ3997231.1 ATP-binding cassette domain-containing protein [Aeromicrobium sp. 636]
MTELSRASVDAESGGIELESVSKTYGNMRAVDEVNLQVMPGEFLSFLGPSGGGKTTTLNMIAGFEQSETGSIRLGGRQVDRLPPYKRNIGMVFQNYALFPHMTVRGNLEYPLKTRKVPKDERAKLVDAALETVRLNGKGDLYPKELSGGMQQRVALARAMVFGPNVLLMDEPLGALDRKLREELQLEIRRIHREIKSTCIYVTHDQEEALVLSDRIAVFNRGRIEQLGNADDLYYRPQTLFVGTFLGESTVLPAVVVEARAGRVKLATVGGAHVWAEENTSLAGSKCSLLIRPESLDLFASESEVPEDWNFVDVHLEEELFLGSSWKQRVLLNDGTPGIVRSASSVATLDGSAGFVMAWDPAAGVVLAND